MRFVIALTVAALATATLSACADLIEPIPGATESGTNALSTCTTESECGGHPGTFCKATVDERAARCGTAFPAERPGQCTPVPADTCSHEFQPVCGCDGKVYTNGCIASRMQTGNRNIGEDNPQWVPASSAASLTRAWQTAPMTLQMGADGARHLVLRYVFAAAGKFELQLLDAVHPDRAPTATKHGTYAIGPQAALKLVYPAELDDKGTAVTADLTLEQICSDGLRISGHDGLPNTDLELQPAK